MRLLTRLPLYCCVLFPTASLLAQMVVRFAVIGDYGLAGSVEAAVASRVLSWNPDVILTTGDNNYPDGAAETIDANIGQYYHSYIGSYTGSYGAGAAENRFFPSLGNHDRYTAGGAPYFNYFTLPGNEQYYDFARGAVRFFAIDSTANDASLAEQRAWLQGALATATEPWKIVYMHHPPFSSGLPYGSTTRMQWPFQDWGVTAVLAGHEHNYEHLTINGVEYFVNGLGGSGMYAFNASPLPGSLTRYNSDRGAMLVTADETSVQFQFFARDGTLVDSYTLVPEPVGVLTAVGLGLLSLAMLRRWRR